MISGEAKCTGIIQGPIMHVHLYKNYFFVRLRNWAKWIWIEFHHVFVYVRGSKL